MAASQKFCLKWNNFQNSVTSVFDNLRQDEELVDITLCCEGQKIKAHRMMLSACSPYFRDLLKENPCQHPVFFLKDTSYPDLAAVVDFVYKGEVNVLQSQLGSFLKTAEMLQVKGLSGEDDEDMTSRPQLGSEARPGAPSAPGAQPAPPSPLRSRTAREPPDTPPSPRVKRRRTSGGEESRAGSPHQVCASPPRADAEGAPVAELARPPPPAPLHPAGGATVSGPAEDGSYNIKVEKIDLAADDDESLEATLGQVSQFEGSDHSTSSQDMAGLLSRVSEQGGCGELGMGGAAGTSEDGSSQAGDTRCDICEREFVSCAARRQHLSSARCFVCGAVACAPGLQGHLRTSHRLILPAQWCKV